jgi:hypothetical protein
MARVVSVGPKLHEITQFMVVSLLCRCDRR